MHRCPVCHGAVDTRPAYRRYRGRLGFLPGGQGIRCTSCNTVLRVHATGPLVLNVISTLVLFAAIVAIEHVLPGSPILLSIFVAAGLLVWISTRAHGFLALSAPRIGEQLRSDDECWPDRVGDDYEPADEELQEIEIVVGVSGESAGVDWICSACGEKNTEEFALCWNCGNEFTPEDD